MTWLTGWNYRKKHLIHPSGQTIDFYSEVNRDNLDSITDIYPAVNSADGQSFLTPSSPSFILSSVKFSLSKFGSPTGNIVARIYAATGSIGSKVPTGPILAESDPYPSSSL